MSFVLHILPGVCFVLVLLHQVEGGSTHNYDVIGCKRFSLKKPRQFILDAAHSSWPSGGFCRAINRRSLPPGHHYSYKASVELYNLIGRDGVHYGHPGLAYNVHDGSNFDFVYFRPHSRGGCFQTGYVENGKAMFKGGISSTCPNGPPKGRTWFKVEVKVYGPTAKIFLNAKLLREVRPHFRPHGQSGVIVANGYNNVIYFKQLKLTAVAGPYRFPTASCQGTAKMPGFYTLDADHGSWPRSGFCRSLMPISLPGTRYQMSAYMYNFEGRGVANFGHVGLMYNARDINNFDFVYFRPHSAPSCFQTGYVHRGVPNFHGALSAACKNGPPRGRQWFQARVDVKDNRAEIYLNNVLIATVTTHYRPKAQGGIIVANGYQNIASFKNFKVKILPDLFPYPTRSCRSAQGRPGYFLLDAADAKLKWPAGGFCRALLPNSLQVGKSYKVSAQLYNDVGWNGPNSGHLGLMYNAKDINNFEFVYFRPHSPPSCFQTGYVVNGIPKFNGAVSRSCANGPPVGRTWFNAKIRVEGRTASIFKDGIHLASIPTRSTPIPRGGVIVANGYQNIIHFKDFKLLPLTSQLPFTSHNCIVAKRLGALYRLEGSSNPWPASGFCKASYRKTVKGQRYVISADIYNVKGSSGSNKGGVGHPGLMYNVKDVNNYEFVYVRPHWSGGCFQTGYVVNGAIKLRTSAACPPFGPPATRSWFKLMVSVSRLNVKFYRDGLFFHQTSPRLSNIGRGGILVANGYYNVVNFKNYKIRSGFTRCKFTPLKLEVCS